MSKSFFNRFKKKPKVSEEERIFSEHFWDVAEQYPGLIPMTSDVYEDLRKRILPGATGKFNDMGEQKLKEYFTSEIIQKNTQRMEGKGGRRRRKRRRKKRRKSRRKSRRKKRRKRTKRRRRRRR